MSAIRACFASSSISTSRFSLSTAARASRSLATSRLSCKAKQPKGEQKVQLQNKYLTGG